MVFNFDVRAIWRSGLNFHKSRIGAQLTLWGQDIFARKCMYVKIMKCAAKINVSYKDKKRVSKFKTIFHVHMK